MKVIEAIISKLIEAGVVKEGDILGCDEENIVASENYFHLKMPDDYRYFLRRVGQRAGMFMEGSDFSCDKLKTINADATDLLGESNAEFSMTKADFVFLMNQGYEFLFFSIDSRSHTGKVFSYSEGDTVLMEVASSFAEWFSKACDDEIENY